MRVHPLVTDLIGGGERLRAFVTPIDEKGEGPIERFAATVFNPETNRAAQAHGSLATFDQLEARPVRFHPIPTNDELIDALAIARQHPEVAARLEDPAVSIYQPMPPLGDRLDDDGTTTRRISLVIRDPSHPRLHQLIGVDLASREIDFELADRIRWWDGDHDCEETLPVGIHHGPDPGGPATVRVRVIDGTTELWNMLVTRPRNSEPSALHKGSGVELRQVRYRGRLVLYQAHVPILNVLYDNGTTYRDWQNSETVFEAFGSDPVGPGWRVCSQAPRTILESSNDAGNNFAGVALWYEDGELRIVSELEAAWYRYVSDWRFDDNGTIRPRFGFAGTRNPATCLRHQHHVYWRLDFDIEGAAPNVIEQRGVILPPARQRWRPVTRERSAKRSVFANQWRVRNTATNRAYRIVPGASDGTADAYGVADLWFLQYHGNELDDGVSAITASQSVTQAHLDQFDNDENLLDTDVVVWYAGHFMHDENAPHPHQGHIIGPELRPTNW